MHRNNLVGWGWVGLVLYAAAGVVALEADRATAAEGRLTLTTQRAVVFKDGYGLLVKQARGVADASGRVHTLEVPDAAVLGSFWAASGDRQIVGMRAEYTDTWARSAATPAVRQTNLAALLNSAVGREVALTTVDGEVHRGVLLGRSTANHIAMVTLLPSAPTMALAEAGKLKPVVLAESRIINLHCPSRSRTDGAEVVFTRAKRLSFDLGAEAAGKPVELSLMYFAPGLRWIPTYRLSGALTDRAHLALQAEILNEMEDLEEVALDLVVGVPHFRFREVISPLTLEKQLRHALAQAAPQLMGQMSNAMFTQRSGEWRGRPAPEGQAAIELPEELTGAGEQDLFVYSVRRFSLRQGGRASVPLWQSDAALEHVYTLDLHVVRHGHHGSMVHGANEAGHPADSPLRLLKNRVWHQLELANGSKTPWTTGSAMILRREVPVGQDLLTYTPPGGRALLPVTVAVNLRGELSEEEIERQSNVLQWGGRSYSLIRKKGTITVTSYRDQPSAMRISAQVAGKVTRADHDATVRVDDFHPSDWQSGRVWQNNHSEVTWALTLKPGESVTLTYDVSFYVP